MHIMNTAEKIFVSIRDAALAYEICNDLVNLGYPAETIDGVEKMKELSRSTPFGIVVVDAEQDGPLVLSRLHSLLAARSVYQVVALTDTESPIDEKKLYLAGASKVLRSQYYQLLSLLNAIDECEQTISLVRRNIV